MKRFLAITISLGVLLSLSATVEKRALAEEIPSGYPESFVVSYPTENFTDYAIGESSAAFAVGDVVTVFDGGDGSWQNSVCSRTFYTLEKDVTALDCVGGTFICKLKGDGDVYTLDGAKSELVFNSYPLKQSYDDGYIYDIDDGNLFVWQGGNNPIVQLGEGFDNFKYYGGAYFTRSGKLTYVSGGKAVAVDDIEYIDFAPAGRISVGDGAEKLKGIAPELDFVMIKSGYYLTPVDLSSLSGEYFKTEFENTIPTDEREFKNATALRLYKRADLSIISIEDKAYAIHSDALDELNLSLNEESVGLTANVAASCNPYSLPFMCEATKLENGLVGGLEVWVVKKVFSKELLLDFYLISDKDDHEEYIGYVATGHVTEFHFNEDPPTTIPDPLPQTDDNVRTVVLILIVVVLVLAAVAYLTWVSTSSTKKKPKNDTDNIENK